MIDWAKLESADLRHTANLLRRGFEIVKATPVYREGGADPTCAFFIC